MVLEFRWRRSAPAHPLRESVRCKLACSPLWKPEHRVHMKLRTPASVLPENLLRARTTRCNQSYRRSVISLRSSATVRRPRAVSHHLKSCLRAKAAAATAAAATGAAAATEAAVTAAGAQAGRAARAAGWHDPGCARMSPAALGRPAQGAGTSSPGWQTWPANACAMHGRSCAPAEAACAEQRQQRGAGGSD